MTEESSSPQGLNEPLEPVIPVARPVVWARPVVLAGAGVPALGPMHLPGATPRAVWQDLGIFIVGIMLAIGLVAAVAVVLHFVHGELEKRVLTVALLPVQGAACVSVVALILKWRGQGAGSIGCVRGRLLADVPLGLLAAVSALAAYALCAGLIMVTWPAGAAQLTGNPEAITEMLPPLHPAALVALMILVGFYEELVFRGFLLTRLRRVLHSWWAAIAVTSLLFALPHMGDQKPVVAIPLFGVGVALSVFTIWRKSLLPAIIGHAVFNTCQIMVLYSFYPDWT